VKRASYEAAHCAVFHYVSVNKILRPYTEWLYYGSRLRFAQPPCRYRQGI